MKTVLLVLIALCLAAGAHAGFINITNGSLAFPATFATDNDTLNFTEDVTTAGNGITITGKNIVILGNGYTFVHGDDGLGGFALQFNNGASGGSDGRCRVSRLTLQTGTVLSSTTASNSPTTVLCSSGDYNRLDSCYVISQGTNARALYLPYGSTTANVAMLELFQTRFTTTSVRCTDRQATSIAGLISCGQDPRGIGNGGAHDPKMTQTAPYTNQHNLLLAGLPATQKVYHVWMYGCKIERACIQGANLKGYIRIERDTFIVDAANIINVAGNCYGSMARGVASNPTCQSTDRFGYFYCEFGSGTVYAGGRNFWSGMMIGTADHPFYFRGNTLKAVTRPSGNFAEGIQGSGAELNISHGIRLETEGSANALTGNRRYANVMADSNIVEMYSSATVTDVIGLLANLRDEDTLFTIRDNDFIIGSSDGFGNQVNCFIFGYGTTTAPLNDPTILVTNNILRYGGSAVQCGTSAGPNQTPVALRNNTFIALPAKRAVSMPMKTGGVTPTMFGIGRIGGTAGYIDTGTIVLDGVFVDSAQADDIDFVSFSEPSFDAGEVAVTCSLLVINAAGNPVPNARVHMKNSSVRTISVKEKWVIGDSVNFILTNADGYAIAPVARLRKERQGGVTTTLQRNPFTAYVAENVAGGDSASATVTLTYTKKRDTAILANTGTGAFYNGLTVTIDSIQNDYSGQLDSIRIAVTTDSRAWPDSFTVSYATTGYPAYNAAIQHFVTAWTQSSTTYLWITGFSMYETATLYLTSRVYDFDSLSPIAQTSRVFVEPPICTYSVGTASSIDTIDFGTIDSGAVRDIALQLTNSGGEQIVGTPSVAGSNKFTIQNGGGVYSLTETQSRTVTLRFAPNVPNVTDYATFTFGSSTCLKTYVLKGTATTVTPPPPQPNTSAFKVRIRKP